MSGDLLAIAHAVESAYDRHDAIALGALYAADAALVFPGATFDVEPMLRNAASAEIDTSIPFAEVVSKVLEVSLQQH